MIRDERIREIVCEKVENLKEDIKKIGREHTRDFYGITQSLEILDTWKENLINQLIYEN